MASDLCAWESFIKVSVGLEADSIFYQFVTKLIMEDLGDRFGAV